MAVGEVFVHFQHGLVVNVAYGKATFTVHAAQTYDTVCHN
jgi:hypothetical protein